MKSLFDSSSIRRAVEEDKAIIQRTKKKKSPSAVKSGGGISTKIAQINAQVEKYLGKYAETYMLVTDPAVLDKYIDQCLKDGVCSIDTETTGLDPLVDTLVGFSLCCPTMLEEPLYVPLNHVSYVTGMRAKNQMSEEDARRCLQRLADSVSCTVMFNAVFDIRMLKNQLGVKFSCQWDCSLASRLMNENEPQKSLKKLYQKYILKGEEDAFKFDELFKDIGFDRIPIKTGYLYAAHDAKVTLQFYLYQKKYLYYEPECSPEDRNGMNGVSWVFFNIEMPIVDVIVELEDTGVAFDLEYAQELHDKYSKRLEEVKNGAYNLIDMYADEIASYDGPVKLSDPINLDSPKQLAVLLYDIMGMQSVDKKSPRGTGEDILKKMDNDITRAILEYRSVQKLMSTYIDKLPACINPKDGRIHCKFNQYGADTGRFSSSDPNLQNIPSHNKDIRKMFKATDSEYSVNFDDILKVKEFTEVMTPDGWKYTSSLRKGDILLDNSDGLSEITSIELSNGVYTIGLTSCE